MRNGVCTCSRHENKKKKKKDSWILSGDSPDLIAWTRPQVSIIFRKGGPFWMELGGRGDPTRL